MEVSTWAQGEETQSRTAKLILALNLNFEIKPSPGRGEVVEFLEAGKASKVQQQSEGWFW